MIEESIKNIKNFLQEKNEKSTKKAVDILFEELYFYPHHFGLQLWSEDDCADFMTWVYPKLNGLLQRYDASQSAFLYYVGMNLALYCRTFYREKRTQILMDTISTGELQEKAWVEHKRRLQDDVMPVLVSDVIIPYGTKLEESTYKKKFTGQVLQPFGGLAKISGASFWDYAILFLACKSYFCISDDMIKRISAASIWTVDHLCACLQEIECQNRWRLYHSEQLLEQCSRTYLRCKYLKSQLDALTEFSPTFERLKYAEIKCQKRLKKQQNAYRRFRIAPSNRLLARVFDTTHQRITRYLEKIAVS